MIVQDVQDDPKIAAVLITRIAGAPFVAEMKIQYFEAPRPFVRSDSQLTMYHTKVK